VHHGAGGGPASWAAPASSLVQKKEERRISDEATARGENCGKRREGGADLAGVGQVEDLLDEGAHLDLPVEGEELVVEEAGVGGAVLHALVQAGGDELDEGVGELPGRQGGRRVHHHLATGEGFLIFNFLTKT